MVINLKLDKEKYIEHIKDKNQILNMRRLMDKIEIVLNKNSIQTTDFLDPYERRLSRSILNKFIDIKYEEIGGIDEAERKIIIIYPPYIQIEDINNCIIALSIEINNRNLSHRDFLGGILNLGINRSKVGDILIHEEYTQVIVKREIVDYILVNLTKIGKHKVKVKEISLNSLKKAEVEYLIRKDTISSLRLDVLISSALNLSRNISQRLITSGRVKVNWEPIDKISKSIKEGDIISVKGYGRFILSSIGGTSKKGKINVQLKLLK